MDWNWFLSSVAQSSAAIVGLFGAFIITRIITNQNDYNLNLNQYTEYLAKSIKLVDRADKRYFNWFNKRKREAGLEEVADDIRKTRRVLTAEEYYEKMGFSIFDNREEVLKEIQLEISKKQDGYFRGIPAVVGNNLMVEEREAINGLVNDIDEHIYLLKEYLTRIKSNPQNSSLIKWSIIGVLAMFYIGVTFPLALMPIKPNEQITITFSNFFSIKTLIISTISLIFSTIMIAFFCINNNLNYPKKLIADLSHYTTIDSYSIYFHNMEMNSVYFKDSRDEDN